MMTIKQRRALRRYLDKRSSLLYKIKTLLCRFFGHKKPYTERMWCLTCPRCGIIVEYKKQQLKVTANLK